MKRSHLCPDLSCKMIWSDYSKFDFDRGGSHLCFGKLEKEHLFIEHQTKHKNDVCKCQYTPLKGMIRFFTNFEDLWLEILGTLAVMDILKPLHCDICNKDIRRGLEGVTSLKDGKKRCKECYFKEKERKKGKFSFDWEGGLSDLKEKFTSVELQHEALEMREGKNGLHR